VNLQQGIINDLSVKLLAKWCSLVGIVTGLLHANYKKNLRPVYIYSCCPWQQHIRQLNHQKPKACVVNLLAAIFGDQGRKR